MSPDQFWICRDRGLGNCGNPKRCCGQHKGGDESPTIDGTVGAKLCRRMYDCHMGCVEECKIPLRLRKASGVIIPRDPDGVIKLKSAFATPLFMCACVAFWPWKVRFRLV